jgi:hypothetical protein
MPTGAASWTVNSSPIGSQTNAQNSTANGDATVTAATASLTTGGTYGYCTSGNGRLYFQTSSNSTNGTNQLAIAISTIGYNNITVSYDVEMISANPRTFGLVLQYRIGTSGSWTTVSTSVYSHTNSDRSNGQVDNFTNLTLPQAAENNSVVQLRWASWRGTQTGNSSGAAIDNISVTASSSQVNSYFRSAQGGNWNNISTWETSADNVNWYAANVYPKYTANTVTIQNGHHVYITATDTIDQIVIDGTLTYSDVSGSTPHINNGTGTDFIINGTFEDFGPNSISWSTGATWSIGSAGSLIRSRSTSSNNWRDKYEGGISNIPSTANWIVRKTGTDSPTLSTTSDMYYPNLYIENNTSSEWITGGYCSFTGYLTNPNIKGNLYLGGNGTGNVSFLNENTNSAPALVEGSLVIKSGSTLRNYGTGFEIQGNLTVDGILSYDNDDSREIVFSGSNSQSISGSGTINIYDFIINKSANNISLSKSITIDHQLTLTSGKIVLGANDLILGTTASISGGSSSSYINTNGAGKISKKFAATGTAFTFLTGDGTYYTPYNLTLNSATLGSNPFISVRVINSTEPHIAGYADYTTRYWDVSTNDITNLNADISYSYVNNDIVGSENNFVTTRWNATSGLKRIGAVNAATNIAGATGITEVGNLTIAGICNFTAEAGRDTIINAGDSVQIGSTPVSGYTYLWHPCIGLSDSTIANPWAKPETSRYYYLIVTNSLGCLKKDSVSITAPGYLCENAFPIIPDTVCNTQTFHFAAGQTEQWIKFTAQSDFTRIKISKTDLIDTLHFYLYRGNCNNLNLLSTTNVFSYQDIIDTTANLGDIYYIKIRRNSNNVEDYKICIKSSKGRFQATILNPVICLPCVNGLNIGIYDFDDYLTCQISVPEATTHPVDIVIDNNTTALQTTAYYTGDPLVSDPNGGCWTINIPCFALNLTEGQHTVNIHFVDPSPQASTCNVLTMFYQVVGNTIPYNTTYTVVPTSPASCYSVDISTTTLLPELVYLTINPPASVPVPFLMHNNIGYPYFGGFQEIFSPACSWGTDSYFQWNLGDGTPYSYNTPTYNISHQYTQSGSYTVTIDDQVPDDCRKKITIPIDLYPTPSFSYSYDENCCILFNADATCVNDVNTWVWDFGDGTSYTGQTPPAHCYADGNYTVNLTIWASDHASNSNPLPQHAVSITHVISISKPIANAGPDIVICSGYPAENIGDPTLNSNYTYHWSPTTGLSNANSNYPTALPSSTTLYTLTVTDNNGCSSIDDVLVTISSPQIPIISGPNNNCDGNISVYNISNPENVTYQWSVTPVSSYTSLVTSLSGYTATITWNPNNLSTSTPANISVTVTDVYNCHTFGTLDVFACCNRKENSYIDLSDTHLGSPITYTKQLIQINGTLYIDANVTFDACDIFMGPNANIEIQGGYTLNIIDNDLSDNFHSRIYAGCDYMWNEIGINNSNSQNINTECNIDHTEMVESLNGVVSYKGGNFTVTNSNFHENYISLQALNYSPIDIGGVPAPPFPGIVYNTFFGVVVPNGLINPHYGQTPKIGININRVKNITIGDPSHGANTFNAVLNGINSAESKVNVKNNIFQNIQHIGMFTPYANAIIAVGSTNVLSSMLYPSNLTVGVSGSSASNTFTNCDRGIKAGINTNLTVVNNSFSNNIYGIYFWNLTRNNTVSISNNTIIGSKFGIYAYKNSKSTATITNNTISGANYGIAINGYSSGSQYEKIDIETNDIDFMTYGVRLMKYNAAKVYNNMIDYANPSITIYGIRLQNCINSEITNNSINARYGANLVNNSYGISAEMSPASKISCNYVYDSHWGINCSGPMPSKVLNNTIEINKYGLTLNNSGVIGPQGSLTFPSDNYWQSNVSFRDLWTFGSNGSFAGGNGIYTRNSNYYKPNNSSGNSNNGTAFDVNSTATGIQRYCVSPINYGNSQLSLFRLIAQDSIEYPIYPDESNWLGKKALQQIMNDDSTLVRDSTLKVFYDSVYSASMGLLDSALTLYYDSLNTEALALNNSITPSNNIEQGIKNMNNFTINEVEKFSPSELTELRNLAVQCPFEYGPAVYSAREFLAFAELDSVEYINSCELISSGEMRLHSDDSPQITDFLIYPNPASDYLIIAATNMDSTNSKFALYNFLGKKLLEKRISNNFETISLSDIPSGIYLCTIKTNNSIAYIQKVIIIK